MLDFIYFRVKVVSHFGLNSCYFHLNFNLTCFNTRLKCEAYIPAICMCNYLVVLRHFCKAHVLSVWYCMSMLCGHVINTCGNRWQVRPRKWVCANKFVARQVACDHKPFPQQLCSLSNGLWIIHCRRGKHEKDKHHLNKKASEAPCYCSHLFYTDTTNKSTVFHKEHN